MLNEKEKSLLNGLKEKMECAVKNRYAAAVSVGDLERLAEIYRREVDRNYKLRSWCSACKLDLLRKMYYYLNGK